MTLYLIFTHFKCSIISNHKWLNEKPDWFLEQKNQPLQPFDIGNILMNNSNKIIVIKFLIINEAKTFII